MRPPALLCAWLLSWAVTPAAATAESAARQPADRPRIVDVVCFVRGLEPRNPRLDLVEPVRNQLALAKRHRLPITFLLQYDALLQRRFTDLLGRERGPRCEIGGWLEVVQPLAEAAGVPWRGRAPWDPAAAVDLTIGYTPAERERLVDSYMKEFRRRFGRLPRTVGSWALDAHTLAYLADRYDVIASCICKEQIGNDGYTLWGGYWGQAYYPSRRNAFMPAQDARHQIPIVVFRMAGSDPVDQFGLGLDGARPGAITLEPACAEGGGAPRWVRWYLDTLRQPCLAFGFAQAGQENAYGWQTTGAGLTDQLAEFAARAARGEIRVETLEGSARWFRERFPVTPATAVTAVRDSRGRERSAVWYDSRHYRAGFLVENGQLRIRDLHLFDQAVDEPQLETASTGRGCVYQTLPVVDGLLWSGDRVTAGIVPVEASGDARPLRGGQARVVELGGEELGIVWPLGAGGEMEFRCRPQALEVSRTGSSAGEPWALELELGAGADRLESVTARALTFRQEGYPYAVHCAAGSFARSADGRRIRMLPRDGTLILYLAPWVPDRPPR